MKLRLKVKKEKKSNYRILLWIQKATEIEKDLEALFEFFKKNILISNLGKPFRYYKVTSENPAIMLSLCCAINELIPDTYFSSEDVF